jgi:Stress responsive A/B Barrel Domain
MSIVHIVLMNKTSSADDVAVSDILKVTTAPLGKIPGVISVRSGSLLKSLKVVEHSHVILVELQDAEHLKSYLSHETHLQVAAHINSRFANFKIFDFENI